MSNNDQILDEFLLEAGEIFDQLDANFVQLEKAPDDKKLVGNIFRAMHTLKGGSGFFAFTRIERVAHAGESLLNQIRDGTRTLDSVTIDVLLETSDRLRAIIRDVETNRVEPEGDDSQLMADLNTLIAGGQLERRATTATPMETQDQDAAPEDPVDTDPALADAPLILNDDAVVPSFDDEDLATEDEPDIAASSSINNALPASTLSASSGAASQASKASELIQPVKVNVELLDRLMNMVSELVLARNRLLSFATHSGDPGFNSTVRTIDMVTLGLQSSMMETRMQPVSHVWSKFPRLVRDVAQSCGKKVELVQKGAETELDRTLLESIRDPLIHIIRNSVDHGIETPEVRRAKGKPETGTITLSSMHENGMVVITIADDGAGIDIAKVAKSAVKKGLVSAQRIETMADRELVDLIFLPGFSTNDTVSNLSGRGVGMDVVRTNVQKIGGTVDISTSDKGTKLQIQIPLTLAIMPAVFVRCGDQRFAIPQNNLFEMVRHDLSGTGPGLEDFYGVPVFRLRNKLIPVLFLNEALNIKGDIAEGKDSLSIVVVQAAGICFGMIVDEVLFIQEVVVKSAGPLLKGTTIYSGATILGDGLVAMIFDIAGIAIRSGLISKLLENDFKEDLEEAKADSEGGQPALLFDLANQNRVALPLDYVDRLEIFQPSHIERRGPHDVIVYGDKIMRLIWLSEYIKGDMAPEDPRNGNISVIVHYHNDQPLGFVVKQIHDIVQIPNNIVGSTPPQPGVLGSTILKGNVVSILNIEDIIRWGDLAIARPAMALDSARF
jgi:two-component system chemotaxis sensor kinase CheA